MVNTLLVSIRNLARNKIRSFLAMIGIILGTLAITALLSLGFGLQSSIESQFENTGGRLIQVTPKSVAPGPPGANAVSSLTEDDRQTIQRIRGVDETAGRLIEPAPMKYGTKEESAIITTMPEDQIGRNLIKTELGYTVGSGRFLQPGERNSIVIGAEYAEETADGESLKTRDEVVIQNHSFEVVGVLERTNKFVVDQAVVMNEEIARDIFGKPSAYDVIVVRPGGNVETVKANIERELRQKRGVEPGEETFDVQTNQEALQSITSILRIISGVLAAIGSISLILGGITIMNTMYTTVLERTQEIGVMKSVGAARRDITKLFVAEAGLLGFIGGLIGTISGLGVAALIASVARSGLGIPFFEALLAPWIVIAGVGFATFTGLVGGYAPARRAARKDPVEALRG